MRKMMLFALPVCFLLACSSDPAKENGGSAAEEANDTITETMDPPATETEAKKLPVPELKADFAMDDYDYLVKYIGKPGKKNVKKNRNGSPCVWSEQFGDDITYEMLNCVESNGYNYRITFAGYEKEEIVKFVEWFNGSKDMAWDREETVYGPKDDGLGCYYRVEKDKAGNYYMDCACVC